MSPGNRMCVCRQCTQLQVGWLRCTSVGSCESSPLRWLTLRYVRWNCTSSSASSASIDSSVSSAIEAEPLLVEAAIGAAAEEEDDEEEADEADLPPKLEVGLRKLPELLGPRIDPSAASFNAFSSLLLVSHSRMAIDEGPFSLFHPRTLRTPHTSKSHIKYYASAPRSALTACSTGRFCVCCSPSSRTARRTASPPSDSLPFTAFLATTSVDAADFGSARGAAVRLAAASSISTLPAAQQAYEHALRQPEIALRGEEHAGLSGERGGRQRRPPESENVRGNPAMEREMRGYFFRRSAEMPRSSAMKRSSRWW